MGIRLPSLLNAKQIFRMQQYVIPTFPKATLRGRDSTEVICGAGIILEPSFISKLPKRAEEEFGFNNPSGGLTIPCKEDAFIDLTSRLHTS